jgi:hypothetical protein
VSRIQVEFEGVLVPSSLNTSGYGYRNVRIPVEVLSADLVQVAEGDISLAGEAGPPILVPGPGAYQVRVTLPSGELISRTVVVPDVVVGEPEPIVKVRLLLRDRSAAEWLGWAWPLERHSRRLRNRPLEDSAPPEQRTSRSDLFLGGEDAGQEAAQDLSIIADGLFVRARLQETPGGSGALVYQPDMHSTLNEIPVGEIDVRTSATFRVTQPAVGSGDSSTRQPVLLRFLTPNPADATDRGVWGVILPPQAETDLLFLRTDAREAPVRVKVRGEDPRMDVLLAYLKQGAMRQALAVGDAFISQADQMLRGKMQDPVGAVVAGYFLLQTGRLERAGWMQILAERFSGIPDGAVIYAWALLMGAEPDVPRAANYLRTAAERGIPLFTIGLRRLYDGLTYVRELDPHYNRDLRVPFSVVRAVAAKAEWEAVYTTFRLGETSSLILEER